jgi:hypothetical protein
MVGDGVGEGTFVFGVGTFDDDTLMMMKFT